MRTKNIRYFIFTGGFVCLAAIVAPGKYPKRFLTSGFGHENPTESDPLPKKLLFYPHEPYSLELLGKAQAGDVQAQVDLGYAFAYGKGVEQNQEQSAYWSREAAEQGNANGLYNLGGNYREGKGVAKDPQKAVVMIREAAEKGFAIAQDEIAVMLCRGEGIAQNSVEAFQWHLKAAKQGWYPAFALVSFHYLKGDGIEQNSVESQRWSELDKMMKNQWEAGALAKDRNAYEMIKYRRRVMPFSSQKSPGSLPSFQSNSQPPTNPQQNP
jgi:TPR repeat protein